MNSSLVYASHHIYGSHRVHDYFIIMIIIWFGLGESVKLLAVQIGRHKIEYMSPVTTPYYRSADNSRT